MLRGAGYVSVASTMNPARGLRASPQEPLRPDPARSADAGHGRIPGDGGPEGDRNGRLPAGAGHHRPAGSQAARAAGGAKDFISKPFDLAEVLMRVHNMLEVRLLHEAARNHGKMLESLALKDPLTGLANRRLLAERMSMALDHARRNQSAHGGGVSGSGRIQAGQQHAGARRRRRSAEDGRRAPVGDGARRGYGGAPGRRRIHHRPVAPHAAPTMRPRWRQR